MADQGLMTLTVTHTNDDPPTEEYVVKPITVVAFERQFNVGIGTFLETRRLEWLYFLAYDCEKRSGKVVKPFDGWLETLEGVDVQEETAPLEGDPSPAP